MELRILTEGDLRQAVDMPEAIESVRRGFRALSTGGTDVPVRQHVEGGSTTLLSMPGWLEAPASLGAKLVALAPGNRERDLPVIHALVVLMDPVSGVPRAVLDGEWLTALRTGAATGVAADLLAPRGAAVLGVIGAGPQARTQIEAVAAVRDLREVRIFSRSGSSATALARELAADGMSGVRAVSTAAETIRGAPIVVTATDSGTPVLDDGALEPDVLISAVGGYRRDMQEVPTSVTARARVVVDQIEAALREAGDVWIPLQAGALREEELVEIGEVVRGVEEGDLAPSAPPWPGVTLFKSVGNAVQDLAVASLALERAEASGLGTVVRG
jgi:ornithine cyclodeaminase